MTDKVRLLIRVYGIVQGVGFRPFVARTAEKTGIAGSVCNKGPYVEIFAEGTALQTEDFLHALEHEAPERSLILKLEKQNVPPEGTDSFRIIQSEKVKGDVFVSPDIAICPKCTEELFDRNNRRYLHPFINCTACGPRLTILDSMPYDRVRTSMGVFPLCPECEYEYTHQETRRYHAQPVCCPACGPHLYIPGRSETDGVALVYVRSVLRSGGIAAVKGIGGFHLCCDAQNSTAVERLRKLKRRPYKPFAVMMRSMETVKRECVVLPDQEAFIEGPQKPILLLERRTDTGSERRLSDAAAPGNPYVGVMLPYAPVQLLLFSYPDGKEMTDCFIMTSGNPSGAPICRTDEEALEYLSPMCDVILSNDRTIRLRADDSVMAWQDGKPYMIRRSRGYAPLPVMLEAKKSRCVLAVGGELKNTFCIASGGLYYLSPYIGDLADVRSVQALSEAVQRMETLLELHPSAVVCDMHPKYNSTAFAHELGLPVIEIQHHYAHILSCMAENSCTENSVIGVSFDGTGYGSDGTVWGGEFLQASYSGFTRLGSSAPFIQAGGDVSAEEGWRIAVSLLLDGTAPDSAHDLIRSLGLCSEEMFRAQQTMISHGINCVQSTSMGRIFDAVSAVLGIKTQSTFEGEASMALEFAAEDALHSLQQTFPDEAESVLYGTGSTDGKNMIEAGNGYMNTGLGGMPLLASYPGLPGRFLLNTTCLVQTVAQRKAEGTGSRELALAFHAVLADMTAAACVICRKDHGLHTVALSGGVMQNLLFVQMCRKRLEKEGFTVLTHSLVPANDGGIALGQAAAVIAGNR